MAGGRGSPAGRGGHFPNALIWAIPDPWSKEAFVGYEGATAAALNEDRRGPGDRDLDLVDAGTPSTGNLVVSVNPIDDVTGSAAALGSNGRCYAVLVALDRTNPSDGSTRFAILRGGRPCVAERATPDTVTLRLPPA